MDAVNVPLFVEDTSSGFGSFMKKTAAVSTGGWWLGGTHMVPNDQFLAAVSGCIEKGGNRVCGRKMLGWQGRQEQGVESVVCKWKGEGGSGGPQVGRRGDVEQLSAQAAARRSFSLTTYLSTAPHSQRCSACPVLPNMYVGHCSGVMTKRMLVCGRNLSRSSTAGASPDPQGQGCHHWLSEGPVYFTQYSPPRTATYCQIHSPCTATYCLCTHTVPFTLY
jgi:hypothetical protein